MKKPIIKKKLGMKNLFNKFCCWIGWHSFTYKSTEYHCAKYCTRCGYKIIITNEEFIQKGINKF